MPMHMHMPMPMILPLPMHMILPRPRFLLRKLVLRITAGDMLCLRTVRTVGISQGNQGNRIVFAVLINLEVRINPVVWIIPVVRIDRVFLINPVVRIDRVSRIDQVFRIDRVSRINRVFRIVPAVPTNRVAMNNWRCFCKRETTVEPAPLKFWSSSAGRPA